MSSTCWLALETHLISKIMYLWLYFSITLKWVWTCEEICFNQDTPGWSNDSLSAICVDSQHKCMATCMLCICICMYIRVIRCTHDKWILSSPSTSYIMHSSAVLCHYAKHTSWSIYQLCFTVLTQWHVPGHNLRIRDIMAGMHDLWPILTAVTPELGQRLINSSRPIRSPPMRYPVFQIYTQTRQSTTAIDNNSPTVDSVLNLYRDTVKQDY